LTDPSAGNVHPERDFDGKEPGIERFVFGRWKKKNEEHRANKQQGDLHALDREGDPRGGARDPEYRTADPRELVGAEGVTMSGPAGAPQEGKSVGERRAESDEWRERRADEP
jgi:hypothetical protein